MPEHYKLKKLKVPLILWSIVTTFFAFQFILRLSAGILREDIIKKFSIDTAAFGTLAGYYYLGYAGMQIPVGVMLDKFNFRIVTFITIIVTVIGTLIFALADNWNVVLLGRFLIGAGSAGAFLSVTKVIKLFFEEKYHASLIGFAFTFGLMGAVFGGAPMRILFNNMGYFNTFIFLAVAGLILAFVVIIVGDKKIEKSGKDYTSSLSISQIIKLIFNPKILFIGIAGGFMVGPLEGFADVWAMPFFEHIHHLEQNDAIFVASLVFMGMCVGGPILAYLARVTGSNILMVSLTGICTVIVFLIIFFVHDISKSLLGAIMVFLGILCCYQVLVFASASSIVERSCAGIAIAIINCLNMSFGHFFHKVISITLTKYWDGAVNILGLPEYNVDAWIHGLIVIPVGCLLGTIMFLCLSFMNRHKL